MENKITVSIGDRFVAGLVDYSIIYGFFFFFISQYGEPNSEGGYSITGLPVLVPIIFWGFFTIRLEKLFGATLGNLLLKIKPISLEENNKVTFTQSLKRHLLDPIDMFLFGFIGIIVMKNTEKKQRLGDLWAKTIVIKS